MSSRIVRQGGASLLNGLALGKIYEYDDGMIRSLSDDDLIPAYSALYKALFSSLCEHMVCIRPSGKIWALTVISCTIVQFLCEEMLIWN